MKKQIVVLSGAGISAESGIATFRDSGGLWDKYRVEDVATPEGYQRNPKLVLDFYNIRRKELLETKPNKAHTLLAELENEFNVKIITQNVDNLHEKAGSTQVTHLHGELMKGCSSINPNRKDCIIDIDPKNPTINMGDVARDGSQLRPFIVWFGEGVPEIENAVNIVQQADILLIVGTSLNVYPAAGLLNYVQVNTPVFLIDPKPVSVNSSQNIQQITEKASTGMVEFIQRIKDL